MRLANVMALGAVQLFVGDIQSGASLFQPMWRTICYEVRESVSMQESVLTDCAIRLAGHLVANRVIKMWAPLLQSMWCARVRTHTHTHTLHTRTHTHTHRWSLESCTQCQRCSRV